MKQAITILLCAILFFSCEDTIEVDLPEVETRLIVDGLVRVDKSQELVDVKIKLRESSNFFEENQPTQAESPRVVDFLRIFHSLPLLKKIWAVESMCQT